MKTEEELIREENARLIARVSKLESQAAGREASHVTVIDTPDHLARRLRAMTHISRIDPPVKDAMHLAAGMLERLNSDGQWRPMRTAPRDGTVIEARHHDSHSEFIAWDIDTETNEGAWVNTLTDGLEGYGMAWRPAHPEWNEDEREGE